MVNKKFALGPLGANCYVLSGQTESVVIDPGAESQELFAYLREVPTVKYILLTHRHCDHVSAAEQLRQLSGAPVAIHLQDAPHWNTPAGNLANQMHGLYSYKEVPPADILLNDGDTIPFADTTLQVLHTPGHTAGGVCFAVQELLFTGDTLMQGSIGRFDFPSGDRSVLFQSLRRLKQLQGNYQICPGHGGNTTLAQELKTNPYMLMLG